MRGTGDGVRRVELDLTLLQSTKEHQSIKKERRKGRKEEREEKQPHQQQHGHEASLEINVTVRLLLSS